ncbi:MAG: hypothetical protein JKX93_01385 [Rhizobiaceae bacterium]|nr:hypothetical protein [Rhizobiaceae bacterium]
MLKIGKISYFYFGSGNLKHIFVQDWERPGFHVQRITGVSIPDECSDVEREDSKKLKRREVANSRQDGEFYRSKSFSLVIELVSILFDVSADGLQGQTRGEAPICQARQICMYLLHTSLSIPYPEIGRLFRRDRTTISHACMIVEDLRDDNAIDENLLRLETILSSIKALRSDEDYLALGDAE